MAEPTLDPNAVAEWCRTLQLDQSHCLGLSISTTILTHRQIYQIMDETLSDSRCFIRGLKQDQSGNTMRVLLELDCPVANVVMPSNLEVGNEKYKVEIVVPAEEQPIQLASQPSTQTTTTATIGPEFLNALGELVEKCAKSGHSTARYKRLPMFSGTQPLPSDEESFEAWMEQALQGLDEWEVSEALKRQRIAESLKEVAADTIRNLKLSKKDCTAHDYLEALQDVFGRTEGVSELLYQFEHTYQEKGEKLSLYIQRLDKILHQMRLKRGMDADSVDSVRVRQLLRGALPLDPVMLKLRSQGDCGTLRYNQLVKLVREEEAMLEEKGVSVKVPGTFSTKVQTVQACCAGEELAQLREQVSKLTELVTLVAGTQLQPDERAETVPSGTASQKERKRKDAIICYQCGGRGHVRRQCPSLETSKEVQTRKPPGNFRGPQ
ncbi:paraneoplastic antigen Ma2-like [Dendropsophus ebraccatus]|uniref:paraneoplastic antigen Ma2-like n=1 Tax=Dendropsophus ebraccatus TaxID=150705 RepID=UPI0038317342